MPYPTPIVEIAFDASPYDVSPTWTNVTSWVRSLSTDRGRSDDWDDFYGSAQVVLNNRTRLFDPYNTSGTYYGKLLPRKQIRIRAQTNDGGVAITHDVFRGFISGWNPQWTDAGTDSTVTLSCFDALQLLGSEQLPADWSRQYILSTSPRHYYPCDDPITPFTAGGVLTDYGSAPQNMITTALASSGSQLAVGLVNSSLQGTDGTAAATGTGAVQPATAFTVSMWAVLNPGAAYVFGEASNCFWIIGFNGTTSKYFVEVVSASAGLSFVYTTNQTYDTTARMVTFSFQALSSFQLYLDGVPVATTGSTSAAIYIPLGEQTTIGNAQVQQVIIWNNIQSAATIQEIYKYSTVALPETTTARANRIIAETPFSSSLCSFPGSPAASVLEITDNAPFVAPELRLVAASECAPLFVSKSGVLTMYQQQQQFTQSRSIVTQVNYGTGGSKMGQLFELMPDGDSIRNEVNVSMSQGGVYTQRNAASVATYGASSESVDSQVRTIADARKIANITVNFGRNAYPRLSPIDVVLDSNASWAPTLGLELMDRITVNAQPPSGGNAINVPLLVQNIKCEASPGFWKTTLQGSARWAAVFIINKSLIGGTDLLG
jgi:hypothetical protein